MLFCSLNNDCGLRIRAPDLTISPRKQRLQSLLQPTKRSRFWIFLYASMLSTSEVNSQATLEDSPRKLRDNLEHGLINLAVPLILFLEVRAPHLVPGLARNGPLYANVFWTFHEKMRFTRPFSPSSAKRLLRGIAGWGHAGFPSTLVAASLPRELSRLL